MINGGLDRRPDPEHHELRKHFADATYNNRAPSSGWRSANVIVRSSLAPEAMAKTLRGIVADLDPSVPVTVQTLEERAATMTITPRFDAMLLGGFAAVGLLLAAIGIYGVIAFLVGQRTREMGVRMALGATPIAGDAPFPGTRRGLDTCRYRRWVVGSMAVTRLLASMLFQVTARDPVSLAAGRRYYWQSALLAAWLPGRRAAAIDPVRALREE